MADPSALASPGRRYVYGIHPVLEALRARPEEIEKLYISQGQLPGRAAGEILSRARKAGLRVQKVVRERLAAFAEGGTHQGVVAEIRDFAYASLEDLLARVAGAQTPALLVVLDEIQDPQNFGAIARSAYAFGAQGLIVAKDRAAAVTGAVAKSSAGAVEHLPIARVTNISRAIEELKRAGMWIVAADPSSTRSLADQKLEGPLALVIGSEGGGIREGVIRHCDFRVSIPMVGKLGSLNASVAAAILLYEVSRQRQAHSPPA